MLLFAFSFAARVPALGLGFPPLLRGAGAWWGRPGHPPNCSWPPLAPAAATPRSGARVGVGADEGGMRVRKASLYTPSPKSCVWPKSDALLSGSEPRDLRPGFSPQLAWRPPSAPDAAARNAPNFPRCPTLAAGRGGTGSGQVPPAALCVPGSHRPRGHLGPRAARRAHLPFHPLAIGSLAAASGATARGTPGSGPTAALAFSIAAF